MQVSRIDAVSPYKVDWRKLTAKEIINYEQQGMEVPSQYLQWARDFINSIESDDETTYERAEEENSISATYNSAQKMNNEGLDEEGASEEVEDSEKSKETKKAEEEKLKEAKEAEDAEKAEQTEDAEGTETEDEEEVDNRTAAQKKHDEMKDDGQNIISIAKFFRQTSKSNASKMNGVTGAALAQAAKSTNEIESLDAYMKTLLKQAQEDQEAIKAEVEEINSGGKNGTPFEEINSRKDKIAKLGSDGQKKAGETGIVLEQIDNSFEGYDAGISESIDYGEETKDIGKELILKSQLFFFLPEIRTILEVVGLSTLLAGNSAVKAADKAAEALKIGKDINNENIPKVGEYQVEIKEKTGAEIQMPDNNVENNNIENEENAEESKEDNLVENRDNNKDLDDKKSQEKESIAVNDGTDTNDKMNTSIDEILKRKIRKGEMTSQDWA